MSGPHPDDHLSLRDVPDLSDLTGDVRGMRVAVTYDLGDWPVVASVRDAVRETAEALRAAGAVVEEVDLVVERELLAKASNAHYSHLFARDVRAAVAGHEDVLAPYTRAWLDIVAETPEDFTDGLVIEAEITSRIGRVLADFDVLLCPNTVVPSFEAGVDHTQVPFVVDGTEYEVFHDFGLTEVFNVANRCPVLTVPAGRDGDDVPIGVQIVGRTYDDRTVFEVARAIEIHRPWPLVAP